MSFFLEGKLYPIHHFLMPLSVTPYISPIFVKGVERINCFNSSLVTGFYVIRFLDSQLWHRRASKVISAPQSIQ